MVDAVLSLTRTLANPGDSFYVLLTGMVNINVAVTNSMNVDDLAKVRLSVLLVLVLLLLLLLLTFSTQLNTCISDASIVQLGCQHCCCGKPQATCRLTKRPQ